MTVMTISDTERREVARRLRELPGDSTYPDLIGVIADHDGWYPAADAADRLADLIEPTKPVDFDGFNHGIDSIYQWCFERLEGADGAEDELYCSIMRAIEDYRHPERVTAATVRPVDRDALLALADELSGDTLVVPAVYGTYVGGYVAACQDVARRIREALGVQDA